MTRLNPWLVCPQPRYSAQHRLYCFAHAGGGTAGFRRWAEQLPQSIELCCVQLPGREGRIRERPFSSTAHLLPPLTEAISSTLDRPFAFYGHSLGGRIAFEVTRELRRAGSPVPDHLFVAAAPAPNLPWRRPLLHTLPDARFVEEIQQRYGGIPAQVIEDPDLCALLLPILRADITLLETCNYTSEAPLSCGITAFGGWDDRMVDRTALLAWRQETCMHFRLKMFAGDHFFPQIAGNSLLADIAKDLDSRPEQPCTFPDFSSTGS